MRVSSILLYATVGLCAPVAEYRYFFGEREIRRLNTTVPATFKSIAIGTVELNAAAEVGTKHALADGHHFGQVGWRLTDTDGPAWEKFSSPNATEPLGKRSSVSGDLKLALGDKVWTNNNVYLPHADLQSANIMTSGYLNEANIIDWIWTSDPAHLALDLFDAGSFVTSSSSVFGDLADLLFNAIEIW